MARGIHTALLVVVLGTAASCEEDPKSDVDLDRLRDPTGGRGAAIGGSATGGSEPAEQGGSDPSGSGGTSVGGAPSAGGGVPAGTPSGGGSIGGENGDGGEPPAEAGNGGAVTERGGRSGTGGSSPTGGSPSGGMAGAGSSDRVPVFMAQGQRGRILVSCDDGRSWGAETGLPHVDCNAEDCDHDEGAARGIAYGDGWFVATFGWGTPGGVRRTRDGVTWEVTLPDTIRAEMAYGEGVFMTGGEVPILSPDGDNWMDGPRCPNKDSRVIEFVPANGGRFVVFGETASFITVSEDVGETWSVPSERPDECGPSTTGIASGNGAIVAASPRHVCVSDDDGDTWQLVSLPGGRLTSVPVFDGSRFMIWAGATVHLSEDGVTWTQEACTPADISVTAVAVGPSGTFVSSQGRDASQRFYRSEDGISWERLEDDSFPQGVDIKYIQPGEVEPGGACP
jgi:hypothetical protein